MKNIINKILTIIFIINTSLLILSSSILVPCVDRNLYYIQIDNYEIVDDNNPKYTKESIINAYDELLDFIWKDTEFKTGNFRYSEDGKDHFIDCKKLFKLDLYIFIITISLFIVFIILDKFKIIKLYKFNKLSPVFYGAIVLLILLLLIGSYAILNFDEAFTIFHKIAFPGKDNWMFDPYYDEIINILPEDYFMSCAAVIGFVLIVETTSFITYSIVKRKHDRKIKTI